LLRSYIREILAELGDPRVSRAQLISLDGDKDREEKDKDAEDEEENEIDEFSSAGAIAGFAAPLGASSEDLKGPGAGPRQKKKRITGWQR
jgi:hypothetical protein